MKSIFILVLILWNHGSTPRMLETSFSSKQECHEALAVSKLHSPNGGDMEGHIIMYCREYDAVEKSFYLHPSMDSKK